MGASPGVLHRASDVLWPEGIEARRQWKAVGPWKTNCDAWRFEPGRGKEPWLWPLKDIPKHGYVEPPRVVGKSRDTLALGEPADDWQLIVHEWRTGRIRR